VTAAAPPAADLPRFIRDLAAFVTLDEADVAAIRRTAPLVLAHEAELTAAVYDHFLAFPEAARFFLDEHGAPDQDKLARRRHSLARWLRETAQVASGTEFSYYLLAVGLSHSHRQAARGGRVPPHLMIGTMSLVQSALARLLAAELGDAPAALAASTAWNKLLLVQLAVLLMGYHPPARA
jgi:hypothetical protein